MNPEELQNLAREARSRLDSLQTPAQLEEFRIAYLGRKGKVVRLFEALKTASSEERRTLGQKLNELKNSLEEKLKSRQSGLSAGSSRKDELLDPTLPGIRPPSGRIHPLTPTIRRITRTF